MQGMLLKYPLSVPVPTSLSTQRMLLAIATATSVDVNFTAKRLSARMRSSSGA